MRYHAMMIGMGCAAALAAAPAPASACDCDFTDAQVVLLPEAGARDVPTNTLLWLNAWRLEDIGTEALRLRGGNGDELELDATRLEVMRDEILVLRPRGELQADARYRLLRTGDDEPITHFFTGAGPDAEAPEQAELRLVHTEVYFSERKSCGNAFFAALAVDSSADLLLLDIGAAADLDQATMAGRVSDLDVGTPGTVGVGRASCLWNWLDARPGARTDVRGIAFDLAGNTVGWGDAVAIEIPDVEEQPPLGGGCSAGGGSLAGVAAALALASRRRQAGRSSSAQAERNG